MRHEMMGFGDAVASAGQYANNLHLAPEKNIHTNTSSLIGKHKYYRNNFAALLIMTRLLTRLVICSLTKIAGAT